jgi:hypothetical protein
VKVPVLKIALTLLMAIAIGFVIENVKVNINYILDKGSAIPNFFDQSPDVKKQWLDGNRIEAPYDYYYNHKRLDVLFLLSDKGLVRLKWFNSFFFSAIFMFINALLMKWITGEKKFFRWTMIMYGVFFALSFGIYLFGKLTGTLEYAYGASRKVAGALQSLVPLMILLPASWLLKNNKQTSNS